MMASLLDNASTILLSLARLTKTKENGGKVETYRMHSLRRATTSGDSLSSSANVSLL